ncbi:MAG: HAD family hydrolase [Nocardioidaceae bacterium]|nr:MAG: HAD family hydrolase [Nocardioidaceae bacterium]
MTSLSTASERPRDRQGDRRTIAAFFDLDKTIIAKSSSLAFSREFYAGGLINRRSVLRSAYAQFIYLVGGADHNQMEKMREFLSAMCTGWNVETVREIVAETLHNIVDPLVYDEAMRLIGEHQAQGHDVVIVSASGSEIVRPIGEMLGADDVIATRLEVVDGKYTGTIEHYVYGEEKAVAITELAKRRGYVLASCFAYSDSITDLPMLEVTGNPTVVNPDKELRKVATERGWPVQVFTKPVALRSGVATSKPTLAALGLIGAAAVTGVAWAVVKRKVAGESSPA